MLNSHPGGTFISITMLKTQLHHRALPITADMGHGGKMYLVKVPNPQGGSKQAPIKITNHNEGKTMVPARK